MNFKQEYYVQVAHESTRYHKGANNELAEKRDYMARTHPVISGSNK